MRTIKNSSPGQMIWRVVVWGCCCTLLCEDYTGTYTILFVCVMAYGTTLTLIEGVVPAAVHTDVPLRIPYFFLYLDAALQCSRARGASRAEGARLGFPPQLRASVGAART